MPQSNSTSESLKDKPALLPLVPISKALISTPPINPCPNSDPRLTPTWPRNFVFLPPYPPFPPQDTSITLATKPSSSADIVADISSLPRLDMLFNSENDAYEFYNSYAEKLGFFIRRSTLWTTSKSIITRRSFVCSREGFREKKKNAKESKSPRPETRIGCPACLTVRLTSNGKYKVTEFVMNHNHVLGLGLERELRVKKLRKKVRAIRANLVDQSVKTPEFRSEDEAYEFYSMYASKIGFGVRRASMTVGNEGEITRRMFVCSKEGFRERKKGAKRVKNPRPETRTGCPACMVVRLSEDGLYKVSEFVTAHNHQLFVGSSNELVLENIEEGIEKSERSENLESLRGKRVKCARVGDIGGILEYLQRVQAENLSFFYAVKSGENDRITSVFWTDAKSVLDFMCFGDVVCFDTSYRVKEFDRPFLLFTGLNHHKQIILFGSGFMFDESLEGFKWIFESFKRAMNGKVSKTVLIDRRYEEIVEAVGSIWSGTSFRFCVWQIYQNALEHLSQAFHGSRTLGFDFGKCLFDCEEEGEFLLKWDEMLEKYDLKDNKWLQDLFEEREKWSLAYKRDSFYGDFKTVQQKENLNNELKKILSFDNDIVGFLDKYEKLIEDRRNSEVQTDLNSNQSNKKPPSMRILRQAYNLYTPSAFKMFEREFELYMDCTVYNLREHGTISDYKVSLEENNYRDHFVKFDSLDGSINCSCKKLEFVGIPCGHILKVLDYRNIKELPSDLILKRWRRDARRGNLRGGFQNSVESGDLEDLRKKRLSYLCRIFGIVLNKAAGNSDAVAYLEGQSRLVLDQSHNENEQTLQERPSDLSGLTVENIVGGGLQGHMHFISSTNDGGGPLTFPFPLNAGALEYR